MIPASKNLLFGTAGIPLSAPRKSTIDGIEHIPKLGLDCLEIEFVRGIKMGSDKAKEINKTAKKHNVSLSIHAPYYINLNSKENGRRLASQEVLLQTARLASLCGAGTMVFHPGYYGRQTKEETFFTVKETIKEVVSLLRQERNPVILRPETMGRKSQFGSLEEILFLCREIEGILPCIDFSHIHSRRGNANSYTEFYQILKKIEKKLGSQALKNMHIHIAGTEYSNKGEIKHINLRESDFRYDEWIQALKDFNVEGRVISESPDQESDACMLKELFYAQELK